MDLLDWIGILLRRWLLTVPLLLLALGGVAAAFVVTPWTYEARATVVFLASPFQAREAGGNPWLIFDSSLTITAEVVGREMMDERTVAGLRDRGLTAAYEIGVAQDSTGPVLAVDVSGDSPSVTKRTLDALVAAIPQRLAQLQAKEGVSQRAQIRANVVTASPNATLARTGKLRTLVMVLFVGMALTVAVPLFAEVLSERRKRGRAPATSGAAPPPVPAPETPTGYDTAPVPAEATPPGYDGAPVPAEAPSGYEAVPSAEASPNGVTLPDVPVARKANGAKKPGDVTLEKEGGDRKEAARSGGGGRYRRREG